MTGKADILYNASPIWLQNILVSVYGYKLFRKRYTGSVFKRVCRDIKRVNAMSAGEQRAFQAERLHEMIKHCRAYVPYYSTLLADMGLTEQNFTDISDLNKLPILDKQTIRKSPELFHAIGATPYMVQHTSGSTGTPLSLWVDEYTYKLAMGLLLDHEESHEIAFGCRRATFAGRMIQPIENMTPPFSRYNRAENQRLFSAYHINKATFPYYREELNHFQPQELIGYPSAIYDIAVQYSNHNQKPGFQPKAIITNSETLLEWQRATIESVFNCKVYDYYGTAEYVTFAGQCNHGKYHFHPLIGVTEVVKAENLTSDTSTDSGQLVASTLTNTTMPLLRYRIGDTSSSLKTKCICGNHSHYVQNLYGRIDDVIDTLDGRKVGRIDHIFKGLTGIQESQVVQVTENLCIIKIVKSNEGIIDEALLVSNIRQRLGMEFNVEIDYVDTIPRGSNGKFKSVINMMRVKNA